MCVGKELVGKIVWGNKNQVDLMGTSSLVECGIVDVRQRHFVQVFQKEQGPVFDFLGRKVLAEKLRSVFLEAGAKIFQERPPPHARHQISPWTRRNRHSTYSRQKADFCGKVEMWINDKTGIVLFYEEEHCERKKMSLKRRKCYAKTVKRAKISTNRKCEKRKWKHPKRLI